jgi:hypothetical protein
VEAIAQAVSNKTIPANENMVSERIGLYFTSFYSLEGEFDLAETSRRISIVMAGNELTFKRRPDGSPFMLSLALC